ncbi:hypothetical protein TCAL_12156 [Tigriopus californicus]|uniref:MARVEL domain-containing protein n=1 Tax=Tigriopus californicus TaxID=6832 RepID=A0A553PNV5_TIGCA|nr:uncharacterized protein LOC131881843 [Tigriopus californicus]TRY79365.1 hypothetical protein TCAL_12156 [Tigriopus californicus]
MCSMSCLRASCLLIGLFWVGAGCAGVCLTLFLLFGQRLKDWTHNTYTPSMEDVVPLLVLSIPSVVFSLVLMGGAAYRLKSQVMAWMVWFSIVPITVWVWFAYNQLKHHGYIDWTRQGMKGCYFCGLDPEESYVTITCVVLTVIDLLSLIIAGQYHGKLKRRYREATESQFVYSQRSNQPVGPPHHASYHTAQAEPLANVGYSYQYQSQNGYREHNF